MNNTQSRRTVIIIGVLVSGVLLWFALSGVRWSLFIEELKTIDWRLLPLMLLVFFSSNYIRSLRWRILLPGANSLRLSELFNACWLGMAATYVLPLRAGEFIRPWWLSKRTDVRFASAFASIVVERVVDVLTLLLLLALALRGVSEVPPLIIMGANALGTIAAAIFVVMLAAYFRGDVVCNFGKYWVRRLFENRAEKLSHTLCNAIDEFVLGLRNVKNAKQLVMLGFWSALLWLSYVALYWLAILAMGQPAGFGVGLTVTVVIALAIAAPSAPGFVGTFQAGAKVALWGMYSYTESFALAYSVFIHAFQVVVVLLWALVLMQRLGLGWRQMKTTAERQESNVLEHA